MQEDGIRDVSLRRVGSTQQWDYCTCGGSSGTIASVEAAVGLLHLWRQGKLWGLPAHLRDPAFVAVMALYHHTSMGRW